MLLQLIAAVHLLCAASLEAHINIRSQDLLEGEAIEQFERLPFESKWLFLSSTNPKTRI